MLAALLSLLLQQPSTEKLFGDWAVVCDNVRRCEATALTSEWVLRHGDDAPRLDLNRGAGPEGILELLFAWKGASAGPVTLTIDGRIAFRGRIGARGITKLRGASAAALARDLARGHALAMHDRTGRIRGTISLDGASAALRYIDAEQGRAGGVTAIVARGAGPTRAVPAAAKLPQLPAIRPPKGLPARLSLATIGRLTARSDCEDADHLSSTKPRFRRLDKHSTLVIAPCVVGAYQRAFILYVVTDGKVAPASVEAVEASEGLAPTVVDPQWNPRTGILASHAKGRGLDDCGKNQRWVWDGERFRLIFENGLEVCRGSGTWLTRYRAQPLYR